MKKVWLSLIGFVLVLMLAACGQSKPVVVKKIESDQTQQEAEDQEEVEKEKKQEEPEKPKITAKDIYDKTMEAAQGIESYTASVDINQQMFQGGTKTFTNNASTKYKMITDPLSFYQKMSYDMLGESLYIEFYSTTDALYVYNEEEDMWGKFDASVSEEFIAELEIEDPLEELKDLEELVDKFQVEERYSKYILTLEGDSSAQFEDIMKKIAAEMGPEDSLVEIEEEAWDYVAENMKINNVYYEIIVDKATYYPLEINIDLDMEVSDINGKTRMLQRVEGEYDDYNSISEIEVPQEIIASAVDLEYY